MKAIITIDSKSLKNCVFINVSLPWSVRVPSALHRAAIRSRYNTARKGVRWGAGFQSRFPRPLFSFGCHLESLRPANICLLQFHSCCPTGPLPFRFPKAPVAPPEHPGKSAMQWSARLARTVSAAPIRPTSPSAATEITESTEVIRVRLRGCYHVSVQATSNLFIAVLFTL